MKSVCPGNGSLPLQSYYFQDTLILRKSEIWFIPQDPSQHHKRPLFPKCDQNHLYQRDPEHFHKCRFQGLTWPWASRNFFYPFHIEKNSMWMLSHVQLCNPMDCGPPGCSVHGILLARILEWVAMPFSRGSSWPRDWTWVSCSSCIADRFFTMSHWGSPKSQEYPWKFWRTRLVGST